MHKKEKAEHRLSAASCKAAVKNLKSEWRKLSKPTLKDTAKDTSLVVIVAVILALISALLEVVRSGILSFIPALL